MACFRVPVRYNRQDQYGQVVVVERDGMIVTADDPTAARSKAELIATSFMDYAGVGAPVFLHEGIAHWPARPLGGLRPAMPERKQSFFREAWEANDALLKAIIDIRTRRLAAHRNRAP